MMRTRGALQPLLGALLLLPLQLLPANGEPEVVPLQEIEQEQQQQRIDELRDNAQELQPSDQIEATLQGGERHLYRLQLRQPGFIIIDSSGALDLFGALFDEEGVQFAGDDDGGTEDNFAFALALSVGEYFLQVEGFDAATGGDYTIRSLFLPDESNNIETARLLRFGRENRAEIGYGDEADFYRVQLAADGLLILDPSQDVALVGALLDSSGAPLEEIRQFPWQRIVTRGSYYIRLQPRFVDTRGSYQLTPQFIPARRVIFNRTDRQSPAFSEAQRVYALPVTERATLLVEAEAESEQMLAATLTDNTGRTVGHSSGSQNARIIRIVPAAIHYLIVSSGNGEPLGNFQLATYLQRDQSESRIDARAISLGSRQAAEIYPRMDIDVFRIEVEREGFITVQAESQTALIMALRDIDGRTLRTDGGEFGTRGPRFSQLVAPGSYFVNIRAGDGVDATGTYKLFTDFEEALPLARDTLQQGILDRPGAQRYFSLEVGRTSDIELHTSGSAGNFPQLLDSMGRPFEGYILPAGRYFVCVGGASDVASGPFKVLYSLLDIDAQDVGRE